MSLPKEAAKEAVKVHSRRLVVIAGRLPDFSKVVFSRDKIADIGTSLLETVDYADVTFLFIVSFCTVPVARIVHRYLHANVPKPKAEPRVDRMDSASSDASMDADPFKSSYTYYAAQSLSQFAMIAMLVYIIDCLVVVGDIQFDFANHVDFGYMVARILYTTWVAFRCMRFKRYLLGRVVNKKPEKLGRALVYDRMLDWIIYAVLAFSIMDTLNIEIGAGLKSVFALSGVGTLVLSLASKDMAALFVSGVALSTSEKFRTGDLIKLGDDTTGVVNRMGLLFTEVRGGNELITKIPNTQLANQRVSNLSRMQKCQVAQTLRFEYADLAKIPQVMESIKQEIEASCPELITDGTRPFRVSMNEFNVDHIEVVVDTRYNLPPIGKVNWENRQRVLEAIARAVEKNGVKFAIPKYHILSSSAGGSGSS